MAVNVHDSAAIAEAYIVGGKMNSKKSKKKARPILSVDNGVKGRYVLQQKAQPVDGVPFIPGPVVRFSSAEAIAAADINILASKIPAVVKLKALGADELLASHDQEIMSIRKDMKELQGDMGRIVKLLAQVLGGDFATEANIILTKRQEVS